MKKFWLLALSAVAGLLVADSSRAQFQLTKRGSPNICTVLQGCPDWQGIVKSKQGPPGPQGARGPAGPQGAPGAIGPIGPAGSGSGFMGFRKGNNWDAEVPDLNSFNANKGLITIDDLIPRTSEPVPLFLSFFVEFKVLNPSLIPQGATCFYSFVHTYTGMSQEDERTFGPIGAFYFQQGSPTTQLATFNQYLPPIGNPNGSIHSFMYISPNDQAASDKGNIRTGVENCAKAGYQFMVWNVTGIY